MEDLGKIAYEAYCNSAGWKSLVSGDPLPKFEDLPEQIKKAWRLAAVAVLEGEIGE